MATRPDGGNWVSASPTTRTAVLGLLRSAMGGGRTLKPEHRFEHSPGPSNRRTFQPPDLTPRADAQDHRTGRAYGTLRPGSLGAQYMATPISWPSWFKGLPAVQPPPEDPYNQNGDWQAGHYPPQVLGAFTDAAARRRGPRDDGEGARIDAIKTRLNNDARLWFQRDIGRQHNRPSGH